MILAAHQPNFMPYMGFFYKMYACDLFVFSDTVQFSRSAFHNYNFISEKGKRAKVTVPVSSHSGVLDTIRLANWEYNRKKIIKRLRENYSKAPYFKKLFPHIEEVLADDYNTLTELNANLIMLIRCLMDGMECKVTCESVVGVTGDTPTAQIIDLCKKKACNTYLSGSGASEYLDAQELLRNGIEVLWSNYKPLEYGSVDNASVFDYLMYCGNQIPDEWKARKEELIYGI